MNDNQEESRRLAMNRVRRSTPNMLRFSFLIFTLLMACGAPGETVGMENIPELVMREEVPNSPVGNGVEYVIVGNQRVLLGPPIGFPIMNIMVYDAGLETPQLYITLSGSQSEKMAEWSSHRIGHRVIIFLNGHPVSDSTIEGRMVPNVVLNPHRELISPDQLSEICKDIQSKLLEVKEGAPSQESFSG